jgi:hypothetical protein
MQIGNQIVIQEPDINQHEKDGSLLVCQARQIRIENNEDREVAAAFMLEIKETIKRIELEFNGTDENPGPVVLAHKAWKSGVALRDRALKQFVEAYAIISAIDKRYQYDIEQKRLAEARKAEEEARKKAEQERKQAISDAKKLGDREAVEMLKEAPLTVISEAPKTAPVQKVEGLRRSAPIWKFRVVNDALIPRKYLMVNDKAIQDSVKNLGTNHGIPGITVYDARSEM